MRGLAVFLISVALSGCHQPDRAFKPAPSDGPQAGSLAEDWTPESFDLKCAAQSCPAQVGLVVFIFPPQNHRYPLKKCTGFLVKKSDLIMTNGHCDFSHEAKGFFLTSSSAPGGRQTIKIKRLVHKVFTKTADPEVDSGRPDAAIFELEKPVAGVTPLRLASGAPATTDQLIGYVVNGEPNGTAYQIDRIQCAVRPHKAYFPYTLQDRPDVVRAFQCASKKTNSGSPLFVPGREDQVEAIIQSNSQTNPRAMGRQTSIVATNARCLDPDEKCLKVDVQFNLEQFKAESLAAVEALTRREPPAGSSKDIRYQALVYPLASSTDDDQRFEVFFRPFCRLTDNEIKSVPMASESIQIRYDEWANGKTDVLDTQFTQATVVRSEKGLVTLNASWFQGFGTLQRPDEHPRVRWGSTFSIELPKCPR